MSASDTPSSIFDFMPETLSPAAPALGPGRLVSMRAQYIVDLSVELHQPLFDRRKYQLATRLGVHVDAASHAADTHEVRLSLKFEGLIEETPIVTMELAYGGLVWTDGNFEQGQLESMLHIDAAALLYPMARQILLDNLSQTGCAVTIPNPNFHDLYDRHRRGGDAAP